MSGVAQQGHTTHAPSRERIAIEQAPFVQPLGALEEREKPGVPALERLQEFFPGTRCRPGLVGPILRFTDRHKIDERARAQEVGHDVPVRSHPVR